jgi:hypothetical protein
LALDGVSWTSLTTTSGGQMGMMACRLAISFATEESKRPGTNYLVVVLFWGVGLEGAGRR